MNLREKIGKMFVVGFEGHKVGPELESLIRDYFVGGVILFTRNIKSEKQLKQLTGDIRTLADRPIIISVDCEGGRVFRLPIEAGFEQWPSLSELKREYEEKQDLRVVYNAGKTLGEYLKHFGFNLNFAPVLDVNTNIKNPVIGDRAFSNDANIVARLGSEMARGIQDAGIAACGKHFPGHGDTYLDSHTALPKVSHTLGRLDKIELLPFQAAIETGIKSIMTAHVIYEGVDPDNPATLSPTIINNILRRKLKFDGVVFTDDMNMAAISANSNIPDSCLKAFRSGCDVALICRGFKAEIEAIERTVEAVGSGKLSEEVINSAFRRVSSLI